MARLPNDERERVVAAIRAHAVSDGDLSARGYAAAANCTPELARTISRKYGLPLTHTSPRGVEAPPSPQTDAPDPESAATDDPVSSRSPVEGTPVTREEVEKLVQAHVLAATQTGPSTDLVMKDPTKAAVLAASGAVTKMHVSSVVARAEQWQTWDEEAGELVRRLWFDRGFRDHFPNPGLMVDDLSIFWWENRDGIPALREQLESASARIDELTRQLDPEVQRRQATDRVWMMALTAAVAGHPLSCEDFAYYLQVADAMAIHSPSPKPPSSAPIVPSREDALTVTRAPLNLARGIIMPESAADPWAVAFGIAASRPRVAPR